MTTVQSCNTFPINKFDSAAANRTRSLRRRRRSRGLHGLAVGYRFMAWQALRRGDATGAAMHAACSQSLRQRPGKA